MASNNPCNKSIVYNRNSEDEMIPQSYYIIKNKKFITELFAIPEISDYKKVFPESIRLENEVSNEQGEVKIIKWDEEKNLSQIRFNNINKTISRNKYLFNDSKADLAWLLANDKKFLKLLVTVYGYDNDISSITQILHDIKAVEDLVIYFDYENAILLNIALNNLDTNNEEIIYLEHIIFYNDKSKKDFIKHNLLKKILKKNELFFIKTIQNLVKFWDEFSHCESYKYQAIAFMLEIFLDKYHVEEYDVTNTAYIILNNVYVEKQEIFQNLNNTNYYGHNLLREYSQFFILIQDE